MLNRIAESFYWIGRYMERIEFTARIVEANYHSPYLLLEKEGKLESIKNRILAILGEQPSTKDLNPNDFLNLVIFDSTFDQSILSCLAKARQNVRMVRNQLPEKIWDSINSFYLWLKEQGSINSKKLLPYSFFEKILQYVSFFNGMSDSMMLRGNEWNFLQVGRFIERAGNTVRIFQRSDDKQEWGKNDYEQLISILESADALGAFRKYHANQIEVGKLFNFLVLNKAFPGSVSFSFHHFEMYLKIIENDFYSARYSTLNRLIAELKKDLPASLEVEENSSRDLPTLLKELQGRVMEIGIEMEVCFFYGGGEELSESIPQKKVAVL
ncbi:alpha-E domain-containing protein [Neobacillus cucumis]|uniref:alpha-E domain-containing protein n=1 Tax=Neobacillus cucumis TaxID=1740721 RepID=UPI0028536D6F|nr:alpha-E domain-containing protein [Neobacillus cucumis]MDR4949244.1 alpha-E domain-containing protein [Neobacillus cucumis]